MILFFLNSKYLLFGFHFLITSNRTMQGHQDVVILKKIISEYLLFDIHFLISSNRSMQGPILHVIQYIWVNQAQQIV